MKNETICDLPHPSAPDRTDLHCGLPKDHGGAHWFGYGFPAPDFRAVAERLYAALFELRVRSSEGEPCFCEKFFSDPEHGPWHEPRCREARAARKDFERVKGWK